MAEQLGLGGEEREMEREEDISKVREGNICKGMVG